MKFSELSIQTQRTAPAELRSPGLALLYRAAYLSRAGELLPLGERAVQHLAETFTAGYSGDPAGFFAALGLPVAQAQESGKFFAVFEGAVDEILLCPTCGYAAPRELARSHREPFSSQEPLPLEKVQTPECATIAQLAAFLGIPQQMTAKALMFTRLSDGKFIFVVVRGDLQMSESKLRTLVGEFRLATAPEIEASGAVAGYASPIGLGDALVVVDELVARSSNLVAGANMAGYHLLNTNTPRDYRADLTADLCLTNPGEACPVCGTALQLKNATAIFADGQPLSQNILRALAELQHDDKGLLLPAAAAPFEIYLMQVPGKTLDTAAAAHDLYNQLNAAGLSVLFDDRDERAGVKFNDADLLGCPVRITVGERGLQNGLLELKLRRNPETHQVPVTEILQTIKHEGQKAR